MVTPRGLVPCGLPCPGTADWHASHRPRVGGGAVTAARSQCGRGGGEESAEGAFWDFVSLYLSLAQASSRLCLGDVNVNTRLLQYFDN